MVHFGQALLYSEASLPVSRTWIFSCLEKIHMVKLMPLITAASYIYPRPVVQLCALDSTNLLQLESRRWTLVSDILGTSKQNHAWSTLTYANPKPACLLTPRKPEHQLLVSFRFLLLSSFLGSHMCNVRHQKPKNFHPTQITFCPLQVCLTKHSVFFQA